MVSVIIINYNTFELTCNCIRSVYKHTTGIEFEVILVDNGSVECDARLFSKEFPDLTLVKSNDNLGFAKGNNLGIGFARGEFILLLNSDTLLVENSIERCAEKLTSLSDNFAAISCNLISPDGKTQQQCSRFPSIINEFIELTRIHKLLSQQKRAEMLLGSYFDHLGDYSPDWFWGTFFMFRKSALQKLPKEKLNDDYFMYCEDMRWCYDFKVSGKEIYYFAGTKVIHFLGGSSGVGSLKTKLIIENELDFTTKIHNKTFMFIYGITKAFNLLFSTGKSGMNYSNFLEYLNSSLRAIFKSTDS